MVPDVSGTVTTDCFDGVILDISGIDCFDVGVPCVSGDVGSGSFDDVVHDPSGDNKN